MYITGLMKTKSEFDCESLGGSFGRREERLKMWESGKVGEETKWERWESGMVRKVGEWQDRKGGKVARQGRWEILGFIQG